MPYLRLSVYIIYHRFDTVRRMRGALIFLALAAISLPAITGAQVLTPDTVTVVKARVVEVLAQDRQKLPGLSVSTELQTIRAEILEGAEQGSIVNVENDYLALETGETFFLMHTVNALDGTDYYSVSDPYRLDALLILGLLFVAIVVVFGGKQGVRGLLALVGSLAFIMFMLLPGILQGYSPVLVAIVVASIITTLGSYVTHGFNRTTSTAVAGMIATVSITGFLAYISIPLAQLTGMSAEEAVYLNVSLEGTLDLAGLLLAGMIIGILGVLYDAAIGQAVSVEELAKAGPNLSRVEVYRRALRIGREHVGALVNTLAIAYVGAALPLLLLFWGFGSDDVLLALNREIFATEIVRTLVGSIGIVLAVPITTAIAAWYLVRKEPLIDSPHAAT